MALQFADGEKIEDVVPEKDVTEEGAPETEVVEKPEEEVVEVEVEKTEEEAEIVEDEKPKKGFEPRNKNEKGYIDRKINKKVERLEKLVNKQLEEQSLRIDTVIKGWEAKLEQAKANNDIAEYDEATKGLQHLKEQKADLQAIIAEKDADADTATEEYEIDDSAQSWLEQNDSFVRKINSDNELKTLAASISNSLLKKGYKDRPQVELLAEVKRRVMLSSPEYFPGAAKKQTPLPNVSGANGVGNPQRKGFGWKDVPELDRQILKTHISQGIYKDEKEALQSYQAFTKK